MLLLYGHVIDSMLTANIKPANKNTNLLHFSYTFQDNYNEIVNMKNIQCKTPKVILLSESEPCALAL